MKWKLVGTQFHPNAGDILGVIQYYPISVLLRPNTSNPAYPTSVEVWHAGETIGFVDPATAKELFAHATIKDDAFEVIASLDKVWHITEKDMWVGQGDISLE